MSRNDLKLDAGLGGDSSYPQQEVGLAKTDHNEAPPSQFAHASATAREFTSIALDFLSHASNEALGACMVGLCATTYYILGRLGLLLIGLILGIALHASWDGGSSGSNDDASLAKEAQRRREVGLDVVTRVLEWRTTKKNDKLGGKDAEMHEDTKVLAHKKLDYHDLAPATGSALAAFTDAIIRDYVEWWYSPLLPTDQSFPSACRQTLTAFLLSLSARLSRKRPADTFVDFVTNSCSILLVLLNELSTALRASTLASIPPADAVQMYLESNPESSLANIVDLHQQRDKLGMVAEDILRNFADPRAYNCKPVWAFLREVLAGLVLEMTVESCSKPEWINGWIVSLLEGSEPELLNALDAGMNVATGGSPESITGTAEETADDSGPSSKAMNERRIRDHVYATRPNKAEDAMEAATKEAKRLNELIAQEDARKHRHDNSPGKGNGSSASLSSTEGVMTPNSSRSEREDDESQIIPSASVTPVIDHHLGLADGFSQPTIGQTPATGFTSFDQIIPSLPPTALQSSPGYSKLAENLPLTLFKAKISIFDDSIPGEKSTIRTKPTIDYMIQIEPASSHHPGWMISRVYADFESLHEIMRRISVVSGVIAFTEHHATLPGWKGRTKSDLREQLERYIAEALNHRQLAESEGMKRFLEKERGLTQSSPSATPKNGFPGIGFPNPASFESMGKGVLDVLSVAPKGAAEGGKVVLGGVTGVFGSIGSLGQKKSAPNHSLDGLDKSGRLPTSSLTRAEGNASSKSAESRGSQEFVVRPFTTETLSENLPLAEHRSRPTLIKEPNESPDAVEKLSSSFRISTERSPAVKNADTSPERRAPHSEIAKDQLNLPPLPSDIPDDYGAIDSYKNKQDGIATEKPSIGALPDNLRSSILTTAPTPSVAPEPLPSTKKATSQRLNAPITEQETRVTVELLFAVINELYNLSSAWNIRRTLLAAAKSFLLRPGNPNIEAIRVLLQDTIIEANTSDAGIAAHVNKVRENVMPTEEERKSWPATLTDEEKEKLRQKARKLLVERGMPRALTSIMGAAASGEALGRVFDCLQVPAVSRGLIFGLTLQGLKAVTQ